MTEAPLLGLRDVTKAFGGVRALRGVTLDLRPGEVHALVGENGAGKSTLVRIVTGAHAADTGTVSIGGQIVSHADPLLMRSLGIAPIYQQPALFPDLTVAENLAVRLERGGAWRRVQWHTRRAEAKRLLDDVGAHVDVEAPARSLRMAEQQLVEIAGAIGADARILLMDEPTAALTDREAERLFALVRDLRGRGVGIIYISHRLEEIDALADRVSVLRDGELVATKPMRECPRAELIRLMVGREIQSVYPTRESKPGDVVLEVNGVNCRESGVTDARLKVRAGEILGLAGLVGAGRTELARVLFGITPADRDDADNSANSAARNDADGRARAVDRDDPDSRAIAGDRKDADRRSGAAASDDADTRARASDRNDAASRASAADRDVADSRAGGRSAAATQSASPGASGSPRMRASASGRTSAIRMNGVPVRIESPADAVRLGLAYVPEDRRRHGVVGEMSVAANVTLACLRSITRGTMLDSAREREIAQRYSQRFAIKAASIDSSVDTLSGGNQQKVALARWLATEPKVLILDEPTQGVDVGAKSEIHALIADLAARGLAIILISSELPELLGMCDRIAVMHAGTIVATLDRDAATQERILTLALGHDVEPPQPPDPREVLH